MAIQSVELWLKGLAAAIGGAAMPKTTPRPGRLSVPARRIVQTYRHFVR
jgi:hypothetical protein